MDWLNYHHLYYFWRVARLGSFTAAASELNVSQSSISEQIRQLEERFGAQLLERGQRRTLRITDQGQIVFGFAEQIFRLGEELKGWSKGQGTGPRRIRIGALAGLSRNFQLEFLKPFLKRQGTSFEVTTGDFSRLGAMLDTFQLDVILTTRQFEGDVKHSAQLLGKSPLVLVESTARPLRRKKLSEALGDDLFLPSEVSDLRPEIEALFRRHGVTPRILGEVDDISLLRLLALRGEGRALIPKVGVLSEIQSRTLRVLYEFKDLTQSFYAVSRLGSLPAQELQILITEFAENLKSSRFFLGPV